MIKIKTVAYLGSGYQRYITFYQDLLDDYYCAFCDINTKTDRCFQRSSIHGCSKRFIESLPRMDASYSYIETETHYVDAAGNLRRAAK
jgi:hypothetical protein